MELAARHGDKQRFETYLKTMRRARTPQERTRFELALASFRDPALVQRTLGLSLGDEIPTQDVVPLLSAPSHCRYTAGGTLRSGGFGRSDMTARAARPEQVGVSSERLARIDAHLKNRYLDSGKIPGALTLVFRRGEIAWLSPMGLMDRERGVPMAEVRRSGNAHRQELSRRSGKATSHPWRFRGLPCASRAWWFHPLAAPTGSGADRF